MQRKQNGNIMNIHSMLREHLLKDKVNHGKDGHKDHKQDCTGKTSAPDIVAEILKSLVEADTSVTCDLVKAISK